MTASTPAALAEGVAICAAYEAATGRRVPQEAAALAARLLADVPLLGHRAYLLATDEHETDRTFRPISEYHAGPNRVAYFEAKYGWQTPLGKRLGNVAPGHGALYHGRGHVMITGLDNYRRAGADLARWAGIEVDLVAHPERACEPEIAYQILLIGCTRGRFTGRKLADYIFGDRADYVGARWVVNGQDRAQDIARMAEAWARALAVAEL